MHVQRWLCDSIARISAFCPLSDFRESDGQIKEGGCLSFR